MKLKTVKIIGAVTLALLLAGCGSGTEEAPPTDNSAVQSEETVPAQEEAAASVSEEESSADQGASDAAISEEQAKKTALEKVPGAGDNDIKIHLDKDDGKTVYEGSIIYKDREYEFEIDAESGKILDWEEESVHD